MTRPSNKSYGRGITMAFGVVVAIVALWILSKGIFWGSLFNGNQTWLIELPSQPVWQPPAAPSYADFRQDFHNLPYDQPPQSAIGVELKWDIMLSTFLLCLLCVTVLFAALSLVLTPGPQYLGIYFIRALALSLASAAAICFLTWLLIGGWGPPSPLFFGLAGLIVGISMGFLTLSRRT
jgi:hypothetical protein